MMAHSLIFSALHVEAHHPPEKSENRIGWNGPIGSQCPTEEAFLR